MLADACRQCMITMDIECISTLCMLQKQRIEVTELVDGGEYPEQVIQQKG